MRIRAAWGEDGRKARKFSIFIPEPKRGGGGGGGQGDSCPPLDLLICCDRQIKSVDGFVFVSFSYFDCSDLQLFAIFTAEKLVGPRCVQIVCKTKQNPY